MAAHDLHQRLLLQKQQVLQLFREALDSAGLADVNVDSVNVLVRERTRECPDGKTAVFEPTVQPDGSVTYEWVCR